MRESVERERVARNARRFETRSGIDAETRSRLVSVLNRSLADTTDLSMQAKQAHWNVKGENFQQLHLLFDEFAEVLDGHADRIAERATTLGGEAMGTVRMASEASRLHELPDDAVTGEAYVTGLADNTAMHTTHLREAIDETMELGDPVSSDVYTALAEEVGKYRWFLESHLHDADSVVATDVPVAAANDDD